jgi:splicing factor 3A subunit 1
MLEELEKASQGKVKGLIFPPPDIKAVVDKTAAFVAKHGKTLEEKIAKFNFMKPLDPYHAYSEHKIM